MLNEKAWARSASRRYGIGCEHRERSRCSRRRLCLVTANLISASTSGASLRPTLKHLTAGSGREQDRAKMLLEQRVLGRKMPDLGPCIPLCIQRLLSCRSDWAEVQVRPQVQRSSNRYAHYKRRSESESVGRKPPFIRSKTAVIAAVPRGIGPPARSFRSGLSHPMALLITRSSLAENPRKLIGSSPSAILAWSRRR